MAEISFFFDDKNDDFVCTIDNQKPGEYEQYGEIQAVAELRKIDKLPLSNVKVSKRFVQFYTGDTQIFIDDIDKFYEKGYYRYIPNAYHSIKDAIYKYQKKKQKDKFVENIKITASRVVTTGLVMMLLAGAYNGIKKNIEKDNDLNDVDTIEDEYNVEPLKIEIQNLNISSTDISELLSELENPREVNSLESIENELDSDYSVDDFLNDDIFKTDEVNVAYLNYENKTDSITFTNAYDKYHDIVEKYATKWGISPNIMMAALTQESAGNVKDNLMQIQFSSWEDQILTAYNFEDNKYQKIVLSNNPKKYKNQDVMVISDTEIKNPKTNISVACVIFRYCLDQMQYNIPVAIQAYNGGCKNIKKVLEKTSKETGISVEDLLNDPTNLDFIDYTYVINGGDDNYLSNVSRYLNDEEIVISIPDDDGDVKYISIAINQKTL